MKAVKVSDFDSFELVDQALWAEVKSGNRAAFAHIYDAQVEVLYNYGKRICEKEAIVEDSIQEVFIDIWTYKENITINKSLKLYLLKSLKRKIFLKLKQDSRYVHGLGQDDALFIGHSLSRQQEIIENQAIHDQKNKIRNSLGDLTKRQQEVIYLKFYLNFSSEEISDMMEISIDAVYNLTSKAIAKLKEILLYLFLWCYWYF